MARFTYHGPVQSIPLAVGSTKDKDGQQVSRFEDFDLVPGRQTPDLPDDNPIVAAMIDSGLLVPIADQAPQKAQPKPAGKTAKPGTVKASEATPCKEGGKAAATETDK